ncbi:PAS domain S-box protein [Bradyrhizobium sp. LHD-71]|uniref:PAS domain S-box protein n=1 Tax=Bradyrhizobium sp. LHD-71 TaxID=3072141 RepID=UPI00280F50EE|nr:PAS domain S-box protein [Bradyrhizobium sp. LHD-71]MDQ8727561.1 PAS domain S-box protein [Bradyrhizobium sp. LHD-71]
MAIEIGKSGLLDALPVMLWTALPDGSIDFVNRRWTDYTGLGLHEAQGWDWQTIVHPDDLAGLVQGWQFVLESGEPGEVAGRVRRSDGLYRRFLIQCQPMHDDAGQINKWCGVALDIDVSRCQEEILRQHEVDFQLVAESIPIPVVVTSSSGEVEGLNQPTRDYFRKTFDELKGWKPSDVVHPDDLDDTIAAQVAAHQNGSPYHVESRHRRADGVYRWYSAHGLPLRDGQGQVLRWLHLLIDVDDRKRAEEALRTSERNARLIVDGIPAGVAILAPNGEVEAVNRPMLKYFGRAEDEIKQWATAGVVHPDDLPRFVESIERSSTTGNPYNTEQRLRGADGTYRWFQVCGLPLRDADGNIVRWYVLHTDIDERKSVEQALAENERNLQTTIDNIPVLAWSARVDGTAEFLNKHYLDYAGLTAEEAQDWGWTAAVHPEDLNELAATWQAIMASGKPGEAEARLRRHDGEYRWFLFRVNPLHDEHGNILKWYGVNTDMEDRKRSEESFRAIVETTPECVNVIARDGTVLRTNEAGAVMAGAPSVDAVVGQSFFNFVAPEHQEEYREFHEKVCAGEKGFLEFDLVNASGVRRHMETHAAPLRDSDGSTLQLSVTRDMTARALAEDALRRSEAFLAEGQHLARMGNLSWNVTSGDIVWSEQLYRIFEFEPGTVVTLDRIATRVHPEDMPQMADMVGRAQRGESDFEYQHRIVLPDQSVKYLHLIAHRARDRVDEIEYIGAVLDITQRRVSEEALEKLRSELAQVTRIMSLGALTASIAHEVNQPLAGIITNASTCLRMLAADPPNVEGARETTRRTIRDGKRAADVIARLRALFGKRAVTVEPVDLNDAAREVIMLSSGDLQRNRVMLHTELADQLPPVGGDRVQLQQVIMNLLRNAADAMSAVNDRPRRMLVRTARDEDGVRLSVRDAGIGFGPEGTERLFDAFYTTKSDGMGIGLSVSRSIIERHNGRLWAQVNDGPGVTFSFSIPCCSGDAITAHDAPAKHVAANRTTKNVAGFS